MDVSSSKSVNLIFFQFGGGGMSSRGMSGIWGGGGAGGAGGGEGSGTCTPPLSHMACSLMTASASEHRKRAMKACLVA